jgi:RND family efflux transporter MFP subunit
VVIDKKIVKGSYVAEGATLYEVSDISTLWNIAEVYEADAGHITVGETAVLSTPTYPEKSFRGIVKMIYPVVNPQSRTVKVRLVVSNMSGILRPNMYTEILFKTRSGRAITVPVGAVLITGKRNLVYVKVGHENHFQAREVGLGSRFDGKYEITFGLTEGEEVVTQGGYLIDSESQLKTGTGATHQHGAQQTEDASKDPPAQHNH